MERELLLAQKMQKKLLPQKFPEHQHLDLFATTIPAYEVGGDFYDFSMINEDKIGIIVGDVSGKGISAAFYMALIKGMFQALSKIYESPKDLLISMNKSIYGHIEKNSFVSLIYGVLDLITGKLYLSRAGHCPMVLISDQESKFVKPLGMGIGLDRGDIFSNTLEQMEIELTKDTTCVFYTDGITEARSKTGDEFGFQRLFNSIITNNDCKADNICNNVIKDVKSFTETESEFDDITLVIFKWKIN
jgi:serine phosphatase RsbU (regulator of sigma subunit)